MARPYGKVVTSRTGKRREQLVNENHNRLLTGSAGEGCFEFEETKSMDTATQGIVVLVLTSLGVAIITHWLVRSFWLACLIAAITSDLPQNPPTFSYDLQSNDNHIQRTLT